MHVRSTHGAVRGNSVSVGADPVNRDGRDAFDNALAETAVGLLKTEAVRDDSPFRRGPLQRLADVELLTTDWASSRRPSTRPSTALQAQPDPVPHTP